MAVKARKRTRQLFETRSDPSSAGLDGAPRSGIAVAGLSDSGVAAGSGVDIQCIVAAAVELESLIAALE